MRRIYHTVVVTSPGAKYWDEHVYIVCLSVCRYVCLSARIKNYMSKLHVFVTCGRGSVLLRRQCNTLCTSQVPVLWMTTSGLPLIHRVTVTSFLHIISMPAVFPPCCRSSSAKCFLLGHHFLSKIALIRVFS